MAAALLSFREGLEAALIVGIVLGYLSRVGLADRARSVWAGVLLAGLVSIAVALAISAAGGQLEGAAEELFEGTAMLLAAAILTWMIFWMQRQGRELTARLQQGVRSAASRQGRWPLFWLAFVAVVREGIELALFLSAAVFASSAIETIGGALGGLLAAVAVAWLVFAGSRRLDLRRFFAISGLLLLVIAAGMVGRGVHELNEAGIVPAIIDPLWSTGSILSDKSTLGSVLKALVGYSDAPSLTQVLAYLGYAGAVSAALVARRHPPANV